MRKTEIQFSDHRSLCVFPESLKQLPRSIAELGVTDQHSVFVLIGGYISDANVVMTQDAIETIAAFAEENNVLIICGGTVVGSMGLIGKTRLAHGYKFPLLGITLENLAAWPNGPHSARFLWWKKERWQLSTGYSHFILVPGAQFGEDSPWLVEAATCLSHGSKSVTILANGGDVGHKDVSLSLE